MLKSSTLQLLRPPKPDQIPMDLHLTISDHLVPISLLTITTTLFLLLTFRRRNKSRSDNHPPLPPEPAGGLPILGHLIQLSSAKKTLAQSFVEWSDRYGPIFTFRLGTQRAVVVNDPETVKECFTTHDRVLASRPVTSQGEYLHCQNAAMGSTPYGSYWRDIRKLAVTQLLSVGRLKSLRHVQFNSTQVAEIDILMKELHQISQTGETIAISELLDQLGFNLITTLIAGKRYFNYGVVDGEDHEEGERIGDLMREFMRRCATFVMSDFVPFVRWIDWFFGPLRSMRRTGKQLDDVMQSWIEEHRVKKQRIDREEEEEGSSDFIDVMLATIGDDFSQQYPAEMIIKATDTTSITMTWILSNLLNNPHTMALAQQELDEKVGRARPVQYSDIENLIYLQAVVKETLRICPSAPTAVPHMAMEDCTVHGYHVPKGTMVFANLLKLHHDPNVWSDPDVFKPERFLDENGKNFEMIPFGFGRRSCPGMAFATQVVNLTVARLLQGFDITSCHIPVDMSQGLGLTMPKATPLEVRLTPRLPAHLYQTGSK
ncbi:Cytochrome P450 CYP82J17 [Linum perenne]